MICDYVLFEDALRMGKAWTDVWTDVETYQAACKKAGGDKVECTKRQEHKAVTQNSDFIKTL